jgi:hypothetical protein
MPTPERSSMSAVKVPGDTADHACQSALLRRTVWAFIALGLLARVVRYGLRFPLWEDECFLCANLIDRGYRELLQPLDYNQAAPFLFLWLQKLVVETVGFHEWGLRLVSFAASVASLFLFRHLAARLTSGRTLVLAVAAFAVGYPAIRYAAEAKPYGTDLLAALVLLTLCAEWRVHTAQSRWLWMLAATALPLTMLSFPASFVGGGVSLTILAVAIKAGLHRSPRIVCAWVGYNVALIGGFLLLWSLSAHVQNAATGDVMRTYWEAHFPPVTRPIDLAWWTIATHAGDVAAWPVGGPDGASTFTFLCCLAGVAVFVRSRQWTVLGLCLLPAAVNLFAAALRLYPYGGHIRLAIYLGPAVCLLFAAGLSELRLRFHRLPSQPRACVASLVVLGLIGLGSIARDVACPWKAPSDERARAFAQWFWPSAEFDGEVACLHTDLRQDFVRGGDSRPACGAQYVCNQFIYSPRHRERRPPDFNRVQAGCPLRCVQYRIGHEQFPFDQRGFERWLAEMETRFLLAGRETFAIPRYDKHDAVLATVDHIDVLTFVARPGMQDRQSPVSTGQELAIDSRSLVPLR